MSSEASARPADGGTVQVLLNAAAGLERNPLSDRIRKTAQEEGVALEVEEVPPQQIAERLRQAVDEGREVVGVAGGDGTLLTAADALAGSPVTLAPVPTGTLNHFSRRLGIGDVAAAVRALRDRVMVEAPVGVVDDRVFLNTATFGFYADVVRRREHYRPWLTKWPAAGVAFAQTLPRLRPMNVTLMVDGKRLERRTTLVWVGVGWGSFPMVHEARERRQSPDLEIVIVRPRSAFHTMALAARILARIRQRGMPVQDHGVEVLHTRQLLIHAERRIGVTLDGEVLRLEPPIYIAVQDGALRVLSGQAQQDNEES